MFSTVLSSASFQDVHFAGYTKSQGQIFTLMNSSKSTDTVLELLSDVRLHVNSGRVLNRVEFAALCLYVSDPPDVLGFALYARIPLGAAVHAANEGGPHIVRFTVFPGPSSTLYGTVTLQAACHHLRILVSFAEEKTRRWLDECIEENRILIAFDVTGATQPAVVQIPYRFVDVPRLRALLRNKGSCDLHTATDDTACMVMQLLLPETLPTNPPVSEVDLVIALDLAQTSREFDAGESAASSQFH